MNAELVAVLAGASVLFIGLVFVMIKYFNLKKTSSEIGFDGFIQMYAGTLLELCSDAAKLISEANPGAYDKEEDFVESIVHKVLDEIISNAKELGFDLKFVKLFGSDHLAEIIRSVIYSDGIDLMSYMHPIEDTDENTDIIAELEEAGLGNHSNTDTEVNISEFISSLNDDKDNI